MNKYKPYYELKCHSLDIISKKLLDLVADKLETSNGWIFLDNNAVLKNIPELFTFFKENKLYLRNSAVTILQEDLPLHIDVPPTIAKINFPILNTKGWVNRWYEVDEDIFNNCPKTKDEFGNEKEDILVIPKSAIKLSAELFDFANPVVFNSRLLHSVDQLDMTQKPRVVASFTFINEPLHYLK
jgi:hypothetical protein